MDVIYECPNHGMVVQVLSVGSGVQLGRIRKRPSGRVSKGSFRWQRRTSVRLAAFGGGKREEGRARCPNPAPFATERTLQMASVDHVFRLRAYKKGRVDGTLTG